jgi:hypothetical protein
LFTFLLASTFYACSSPLVDEAREVRTESLLETSHVEAAIAAALSHGTPENFVSDTEAASIVAAFEANPDPSALGALTRFHTRAPRAWPAVDGWVPGVDGWVGVTPRPYSLLAYVADEKIERSLTTHGADAATLLLAKFTAMPPAMLPTPPASSSTVGEWVSAISNGRASYPAKGRMDTTSGATAYYYENHYTTGTAAYLTIASSSPRAEFAFKGPKLVPGGVYEAFCSGDPTTDYVVNISVLSWGTGSCRARYRLQELVLVGSEVQRAVLSWITSSDLRYGLEPGFIVYQR